MSIFEGTLITKGVILGISDLIKKNGEKRVQELPSLILHHIHVRCAEVILGKLQPVVTRQGS